MLIVVIITKKIFEKIDACSRDPMYDSSHDPMSRLNNNKKVLSYFVRVYYRLRMAGVEGLQGVIRKTVSDELQVNIWEDLHMGKIVPSLLFNMAEKLPSAGDSDEQGPTSRLLRQGKTDILLLSAKS